MILLTGATGTVGAALLRRLTAGGEPVRVLVRDPKRLGSERVRVQIALGDLADPGSFRNAMRGVRTVVHLGASTRDQPGGSIEEINAVATMRLIRTAERTGVRRFVHFSALGAAHTSPSRFLRSKALALDAVRASRLATTVFAPSVIYDPEASDLRRLDRFSVLPALLHPGDGTTEVQPVWAEDVAQCVIADLDRDGEEDRDYVLAGPEIVGRDRIGRMVAAAAGRRRRVAHLPLGLLEGPLKGVGRLAPAAAPLTWDEVGLMQESMTSSRGTADAEALGVTPRRLAAVLGRA